MERYSTHPLGRHHDRRAFKCGRPELDRYIARQATQDQRRRVAAVVVLTNNADASHIAGYYTLSASSVRLAEIPTALSRRLPVYPMLPTVLLGRLAVHIDDQGRGLGERLLVDALRRSAATAEQVAALAVVVDAIDEAAASFYRRFGFIALADRPEKLFLPMGTIRQLGLPGVY
jgi:predicted GNAT family N-acyltransferase